MAQLEFLKRQKIINLAGNCFWFFDSSFYPFLRSCGVTDNMIKKYPKDAFNKFQIMDNILNDLEGNNNIEIIKRIISSFYRMKVAADEDYFKNNCPEKSKKAKELLEEFRDLVGNDPIDQAIKDKEAKENRDRYQGKVADIKSKKDKLLELKKSFISMHSRNDEPQQRGFDFERLFFDILNLEQFEFIRPYKNIGEQIDGFFKYEKFDYLVDIKWEKDVAKNEFFAVFDGKIKGKAQSTRGLLVSVNGFCPNAISRYSGDTPRILAMEGSEIMMILEDRISFYDCLKSKIDAFVRKGEIFHKINFLKS